MDFKSTLSGVLSGLSTLGKHNYAEPLPSSFICGGKTSDGKWVAGFSQKEILPDDYDTKKYYIAGYHENNPAEGLLDPQTVSALILGDGTDKGNHLFISVDAVGLISKDVETIRNSLKVFCNNAGIASISVFCTHDHAGIDTMGLWGNLPHTGKNKKFMSILFNACYTAAIEAYRNRKTGSLHYGFVNVPDMQEDVRTPVVFSDKLARFRFHPDNGDNDIFFINFAAHAESLQSSNSYISADFPEYMRNKIKQENGADTLYSNGAIGGMITMKIENEDELKSTGRLPENTREIGEKLAGYALSVDNEIELSPSLLYARKELYCEVDNPVLTIACNIGILNADRFDLPYSSSKALKTEISYYEIGGVKIACVPGELFPELAYGGYLTENESSTRLGGNVNPIPLCETAEDDEMLIIGLCNDEIGYIIPPNDFLLNPDAPYMEKAIDDYGRIHYEETNSLGEGTAQNIATAFQQLIEDVNTYKTEVLQ